MLLRNVLSVNYNFIINVNLANSLILKTIKSERSLYIKQEHRNNVAQQGASLMSMSKARIRQTFGKR